MKFETIDLRDLRLQRHPLVNQAFALWMETYLPILGGVGLKLKPSTFYSAQFLNVIHRDGEVLSLALANVRDTGSRALEDVSYFSPMLPDRITKLRRDFSKVMSLEFITVHPRERARVAKIRQPELIVGCISNVFLRCGAEAAVGFSRIDLGADRLAAQFGFVPHEPTKMFGIECILMIAKRSEIRRHKHAVIQNAIDGLLIPESTIAA